MLSGMCPTEYLMRLRQVYQWVNPDMETDLRRGLFLHVFFIENAVENIFKFILVREQNMELLQIFGVVAP